MYSEPRVLWICPDFAWELLKLTLSVDDSSNNNQLRRAIYESQSSRSRYVYLVPPERANHVDVVEGKRLLYYSLVAPAVIQQGVPLNEQDSEVERRSIPVDVREH